MRELAGARLLGVPRCTSCESSLTAIRGLDGHDAILPSLCVGRCDGVARDRTLYYINSSMQCRLVVRAATLILALLVPFAGVRATALSCCSADHCDLPCCR